MAEPVDTDRTDHLAALCMAGVAGSFGAYTPERVTLTLGGDDPATDQIVYLHEAHHAALNDSTAWGTALQVLAALSAPQRASFAALLNVCRAPHEAYATFAAVNVVGAHYRGARQVLDHYPGYVRLYEVLCALVDGAGGPHRRYLAATAAARLTMQTPILETMLSDPALLVTLGDIRLIDTPNGRWRWLTRSGAPHLARAVQARPGGPARRDR